MTRFGCYGVAVLQENTRRQLGCEILRNEHGALSWFTCERVV